MIKIDFISKPFLDDQDNEKIYTIENLICSAPLALEGRKNYSFFSFMDLLAFTNTNVEEIKQLIFLLIV